MSTPVSPARSADHVEAALDLLAARPLVVLTGAGLSTDSGIPDYRGPDAPPRRPMTYQEFVSGPAARQRYWARSHLGWGRMRRAEPNPGHHVLARIDPELLITQNVDGLHERVGTPRLVALHGRIADVVCLDCRRTGPRAGLHDVDSLVAALDSGRLAAAALDHVDGETLPHGHPLLGRDNVLLTPHIGGATYDVETRQTEMIVADVKAILAGQRPTHCKNPEVLGR